MTVRHYGPGNHPSGSSQDVHAGGATGPVDDTGGIRGYHAREVDLTQLAVYGTSLSGSMRDLGIDDPGQFAASYADVFNDGTYQETYSAVGMMVEDLIVAHGGDGLPEVVKGSRILQDERDGLVVWERGIREDEWLDGSDEDAAKAEEFRTGKLFVGQGIFGDGVYVATGAASVYVSGDAGKDREPLDAGGRHAVASEFALEGGSILWGSIKPEARVITQIELQHAIERLRASVPDDATAAERAVVDLLTRTPTTLAAAAGYDAVAFPDTSLSGNLHGDQYVILDRTMVRVSRTDLKPARVDEGAIAGSKAARWRAYIKARTDAFLSGGLPAMLEFVQANPDPRGS